MRKEGEGEERSHLSRKKAEGESMSKASKSRYTANTTGLMPVTREARTKRL
jgi:hypothetical protein